MVRRQLPQHARRTREAGHSGDPGQRGPGVAPVCTGRHRVAVRATCIGRTLAGLRGGRAGGDAGVAFPTLYIESEQPVSNAPPQLRSRVSRLSLRMAVRAVYVQVEPQVASGPEQVVAFKTAAFNRSATSPHRNIGQLERISGRAHPASIQRDEDSHPYLRARAPLSSCRAARAIPASIPRKTTACRGSIPYQ
jgi:hypothetical protein